MKRSVVATRTLFTDLPMSGRCREDEIAPELPSAINRQTRCRRLRNGPPDQNVQRSIDILAYQRGGHAGRLDQASMPPPARREPTAVTALDVG